MSTTIDLTPTYAESARICAYWLASHSGKSPEFFLAGDYWTDEVEYQKVAIATFNKIDVLADAMDSLGAPFHKQSKTLKTRLIMNAFAKAKEIYLTAN